MHARLARQRASEAIDVFEVPVPGFPAPPGVVSTLGLAGGLPAGEFCALVLDANQVPAGGLGHLRPVAAAVRSAVARHLGDGASGERDYLAAVEQAAREQAGEPDLDAACDALIERLTRGSHDDIAFIHVQHKKGAEPA